MSDRFEPQHDASTLVALTRLVNDALDRWSLPDGARATLINVSENATYLVSAAEQRWVLRVHRPFYHSRAAIQSELTWLSALAKDTRLVVPKIVSGRDGEWIQTITCDAGDPARDTRDLVLFEFIHGTEPKPDDDLVQSFEQLGRIAAVLHDHTNHWSMPKDFERHHWDENSVLGANPTWGHWREAPGVDDTIAQVLSQVEALLRQRLSTFGKDSNRFGLIHADMRLANLLISESHTALIDFDDCGFGWFMYDFAASISFMEDHPQVPALQHAWVKGYRTQRELTLDDEREIQSFIMLRRLALLAWIGTHHEVDIARELAPTYAQGTAVLGQHYLASNNGLQR